MAGVLSAPGVRLPDSGLAAGRGVGQGGGRDSGGLWGFQTGKTGSSSGPLLPGELPSPLAFSPFLLLTPPRPPPRKALMGAPLLALPTSSPPARDQAEHVWGQEVCGQSLCLPSVLLWTQPPLQTSLSLNPASKEGFPWLLLELGHNLLPLKEVPGGAAAGGGAGSWGGEQSTGLP